MKEWITTIGRVRKKTIVAVALAILAVAIVGVSTTLALMKVQATEVTNEFKAAKINVQVVEEKEDGNTFQSDSNNKIDFGKLKTETIKKVKIENLNLPEYPTTDAFVRCRIVPVLRDEEGNNIATRVEYEISSKNAEWSQESLGTGETYYYWTKILPKGEKTEYLFESVTVTSEIPDGAHLELQVLVDAIQARPYADDNEGAKKTPVYEAWGWYYDTTNNELVKGE